MEILGLLDTLESMILDGFKIPLTKKTLINEEQILGVIDKIRLVVQGGGNFAKTALGGRGNETAAASEVVSQLEEPSTPANKSTEVLQQAYQLAKEVKEGADNYADEVLSNLELTVTRLIRTIKAGRERLDKTVRGENEKA